MQRNSKLVNQLLTDYPNKVGTGAFVRDLTRAIHETWIELKCESSGRSRATRRRKARAYRSWLASEIANAMHLGNIPEGANLHFLAYDFLRPTTVAERGVW